MLASLGVLAACGSGASQGAPDGSAGGADSGGPDRAAATSDGTAADAATVEAAAADVAAGAAAGPIGSPCDPAAEIRTSFDGFSEQELSRSASGEPTCLVYHFRGLVTCPYGQSAAGQAPAGASPCTTTGGQPVTGLVSPQCTDRRPAETVVWSCRCANFDGRTDDGDAYCACPSSMTCVPAFPGVGAEDPISGAYCVYAGVVFDGGRLCTTSCDPVAAPCP
jgi:hypothetical protein